MTLRPYLRPILGLSASTLFLASTFSTKSSSSLQNPISTMSSSSSPPWQVKPYQPRHSSWPYSPSDFLRQDPSPDTSFYTSPRFVTHIDDAAISSLREYYSSVLPTGKGSKILDFCSSWISHYPPAVETAASKTPPELDIIGLGLNAKELEANPVLNAGRIVHDLNEEPGIAEVLLKAGCVRKEGGEGGGGGLISVATNVVSTDYLTRPVEVLRSLREVMEIGGKVHLVISNRCFPTKAIARWLRIDEEERLLMVGDFLHFAGWKGIEIVELSDGSDVGEEGGRTSVQGSLRGLMGLMGMNSRDPLWVVRAVNEG